MGCGNSALNMEDSMPELFSLFSGDTLSKVFKKNVLEIKLSFFLSPLLSVYFYFKSKLLALLVLKRGLAPCGIGR